jgi:hypothetical protein
LKKILLSVLFNLFLIILAGCFKSLPRHRKVYSDCLFIRNFAFFKSREIA